MSRATSTRLDARRPVRRARWVRGVLLLAFLLASLSPLRPGLREGDREELSEARDDLVESSSISRQVARSHRRVAHRRGPPAIEARFELPPRVIQPRIAEPPSPRSTRPRRPPTYDDDVLAIG